MANICKYCVMRYGIKGSEIYEKDLSNDEDFYNHIEEVHGIPVMREGETKEDTEKRCAAKGIVSDRNKCQCQECKEIRKQLESKKIGTKQ